MICIDNLDTGTLENIEHIRDEKFVVPLPRPDRVRRGRRAGRLHLPPGLAGEPDRLRAAAAPHPQGRLLRHPPHARRGEVQAGPHPGRLDLGGLRRPRDPPPAGGLLGERQPDRPARRLRRGQALRRGADDGLPPPAGRQHLHRRGSSTPTARGCGPTTAARSRPSCARPSRTSRSPSSATAARRGASATSTTRSDGLVALAESDVHLPVNIGNQDEYTLLQLAETVIEVAGSRSEIVFEPLPVDDPKIRQPDITRAKQLLGWEPEVGLQRRAEADDRRGRRRAPRRAARLAQSQHARQLRRISAAVARCPPHWDGASRGCRAAWRVTPSASAPSARA